MLVPKNVQKMAIWYSTFMIYIYFTYYWLILHIRSIRLCNFDIHSIILCNFIGKELQLPCEEDLSSEVKEIREQFSRCHLDACRARISMCRRRLLKVYRGVFSGTDLVNWLLEVGIVDNREDAVRYGRCLLESRVLQHVDGTHHFYDQNLLYTFNA